MKDGMYQYSEECHAYAGAWFKCENGKTTGAHFTKQKAVDTKPQKLSPTLNQSKYGTFIEPLNKKEEPMKITLQNVYEAIKYTLESCEAARVAWEEVCMKYVNTYGWYGEIPQKAITKPEYIERLKGLGMWKEEKPFECRTGDRFMLDDEDKTVGTVCWANTPERQRISFIMCDDGCVWSDSAYIDVGPNVSKDVFLKIIGDNNDFDEIYATRIPYKR